MSGDRKTAADITRQAEMLQHAYAHAGRPEPVKLVRDGRRWSLYLNDYKITDGAGTANELWERLLDMRRAVEMLDRRGEVTV